MLCYKYVYSDVNGVMSCALSMGGKNKKRRTSVRVVEEEPMAQNTERSQNVQFSICKR